METLEVETWEFETTYITTDPSLIETEIVFNYLHNQAYWCKNIPQDTVLRAIQHSTNFSVFSNTELPVKNKNNPLRDRFVGFGRLVTDHATFAYLADVFILPEHQGQGHGKYLIQAVNSWIINRNLRTSLLLTRDAQKLYEKFDWTYFKDVKRVMRYKEADPNFYQKLQ